MGSPLSKRVSTASLALVVAVSAISSSAILAREAGAAAVAISFWRTAGGSALLTPLALRQSSVTRLRPVRLERLLVGSGACLALHFALWLGSLELTTVASSVTLVSLAPLFVGFGSRLIGESVSRSTWIAMGVTISGAIVISVADKADPGATSNALLGDAMALGGAAALAGYIIIGRIVRRSGIPNAMFAAPTYAVAAVILLAVGLIGGVDLFGYSTRTWVLLLAIVLGPQLLGHALLTWVLGRLPATTVSAVTLAEPIGATILAWLVLDEIPASLFWVGAPLVLLGLMLTQRRDPSAIDDGGAEPGFNSGNSE